MSFSREHGVQSDPNFVPNPGKRKHFRQAAGYGITFVLGGIGVIGASRVSEVLKSEDSEIKSLPIIKLEPSNTATEFLVNFDNVFNAMREGGLVYDVPQKTNSFLVDTKELKFSYGGNLDDSPTDITLIKGTVDDGVKGPVSYKELIISTNLIHTSVNSETKQVFVTETTSEQVSVRFFDDQPVSYRFATDHKWAEGYSKEIDEKEWRRLGQSIVEGYNKHAYSRNDFKDFLKKYKEDPSILK